jgi:hypothetical protein
MASGVSAELGADVAEAQALLAQATRPAVKAVLEKLIQSQQALIDKAAAAAAEGEQRKQAFIETTTKEIEALEAKKTKAASDEDFETASSLRDQVRWRWSSPPPPPHPLRLASSALSRPSLSARVPRPGQQQPRGRPTIFPPPARRRPPKPSLTFLRPPDCSSAG